MSAGSPDEGSRAGDDHDPAATPLLAGDRYAVRVEGMRDRPPVSWAKWVWIQLAGLLEGWLPAPTSGAVVLVEPAVADREVLRLPVTLDDVGATLEMVERDLARLSPGEFLAQWRVEADRDG